MRRIRIGWIVIPLVAVILLFILAAALLLSDRDQSAGREQVRRLYQETEYTEYREKWQEGVITYKGEKYQYDGDNKVFLLMGIDKNEKVREKADGEGGCADAIFLLVQNKKKKTLSVVSVNRNTMTRVCVYSPKGKKLGEYTLQLCLQHAYGDGGRSSCSRSMDAVSYLLRDVPISGYMALNMAGIPSLNDAVGGVPVTVTEEMVRDLPALGLKVGEVKTLSGSEAMDFLRDRDQRVFDSATARLRRQEEYLTGLFAQIKNTVRGDQKRGIKLYETLEEYLVTNVQVRDVIGEWLDYSYDPASLRTVPGRTVKGEVYEEFRVDKDGLKALIMEVFYKKIS